MQDKCYTTRCDCGKCSGYEKDDCEKKHHSHSDEECCECRNVQECYECGTNFKEAVCIHTDKIFDSCRDKDCLENIRVYLTQCGQEVVDRAINVKCVKAEVIWVFTDVNLSKYNNVIWVST